MSASVHICRLYSLSYEARARRPDCPRAIYRGCGFVHYFLCHLPVSRRKGPVSDAGWYRALKSRSRSREPYNHALPSWARREKIPRGRRALSGLGHHRSSEGFHSTDPNSSRPGYPELPSSPSDSNMHLRLMGTACRAVPKGDRPIKRPTATQPYPHRPRLINDPLYAPITSSASCQASHTMYMVLRGIYYKHGRRCLPKG
jgi:hypothetical protein